MWVNGNWVCIYLVFFFNLVVLFHLNCQNGSFLSLFTHLAKVATRCAPIYPILPKISTKAPTGKKTRQVKSRLNRRWKRTRCRVSIVRTRGCVLGMQNGRVKSFGFRVIVSQSHYLFSLTWHFVTESCYST